MNARAAAAACLLLAVVGGCTSSSGSAKGSASASASASSSSPTPTPTPTPVALPATCQELLPIVDLDRALGVPLVGRTVYIEGQPEPAIKRTGRVTCRYGERPLPGNKWAPARLEVGVSGYADAAAATTRIERTVSSARSSGAVPTEVTLGGLKGTALTGNGSGLLVVAAGNRTVAITLASGVVPVGRSVPAMTAVAEVALKNLPPA